MSWFSRAWSVVKSVFTRGDNDSDDDNEKEEGYRQDFEIETWGEPEEPADAWGQWVEGGDFAEYEEEPAEDWEDMGEPPAEDWGIDAWGQWAEGQDWSIAPEEPPADESEEWGVYSQEIYNLLGELSPEMAETISDMVDTAETLDELVEIGLFAYDLLNTPKMNDAMREELDELVNLLPQDEAESIRVLIAYGEEADLAELIMIVRERIESMAATHEIGLLVEPFDPTAENARPMRERARFRNSKDAAKWIAGLGGGIGYFAYSIADDGEIVLYEYAD